MAYNSLRKKVAKGLVQISDKFKDQDAGKPVIEISRENLAHVIGAAPESLIRTLSDFRAEKLVDIKQGKIIIMNENKLRNLLY